MLNTIKKTFIILKANYSLAYISSTNDIFSGKANYILFILTEKYYLCKYKCENKYNEYGSHNSQFKHAISYVVYLFPVNK